MKIGNIQVTIIDMVTFCGMMVTLFTSILNLFQNRKSMYINNIIKCRLESINELKKYVCSLKELSSIINLKIICRKKDKVVFRKELEKCIAGIELYLNPSRKLDRKIILYCRNIKIHIYNYMNMNYLKNEMIKNHNEKILENFKEAVKNINDIYFFYDLIKAAGKSCNLDEGKEQVYHIFNKVYHNEEIIIKVLSNYDQIMQTYENSIESMVSELDYLIYLYVELKWIRCKKEMKMWPFNKYRETKEIEKLLE